MNPLTQIKNTQKATRKEWEAGLAESASWHARFKHSAYVFAGGLNYELTEGDLLAVFSQYGEVVDANLVRDKDTGKSRGFAFLAYENQSSTVLAVDNLSGAKVAGRIIRVEHVDDYKRKVQEMGGDVEENDEKAPNLPEASTIDAPRWGKVDDASLKPHAETTGNNHLTEAPGSVMELMKAHLRKKNQEIVNKAEGGEKKKKKESRRKEKHKHKSRKGDSKRQRSRSRSKSKSRSRSGSPDRTSPRRQQRDSGHGNRGGLTSIESREGHRYSRAEDERRGRRHGSDHQSRSTYRRERN